ncbi:MAG: family 16 glycoside hydrolase [Bacteroidota bacterium]
MNLKLYSCLIMTALWMCISVNIHAQSQFPLKKISFEDLSAFQPTAKNWKIKGDVQAPLDKNMSLNTHPGTGILINQPDDKNKAQLYTRFEHGDIDLDLELMMPLGSNSGIYLQGRYEVQLLDSWGKKRPNYGDLGGIYQRWDDSQADGEKGFEGIAPLTNASKAPGLWQRMKISFQAPRFDSEGNKIKNARIIYVELNGIMIHQNVELTGPTRGAYVGEGKEAAFGPIVIQGDHGPVAFRNVKYRIFDGEAAKLKELNYKVVRRKLKKGETWDTIETDFKGKDRLITWGVARSDNDFSILYEGQIEVAESADYLFTLSCQGVAQLWIEGESIINMYSSTRSKLKRLSKGITNFKLEYVKEEAWRQGQLALSVEGSNFRPLPLNYESSGLTSNPTNPIYEEVGREARLLRSFVDFEMAHMDKPKKITNAINVGDPSGLHYTYDLKQGSLVQVWRGDFLNMTPMWDNRGNGVSRAIGMLVAITPDIQLMQRSSDGNLQLAFEENQYRFRSYKVDADNRPTFYYQAHGLKVIDRLIPSADRKSINRELAFEGEPVGELLYCLTSGNSLVQINKELYMIDDSYYIQTGSPLKIEKLKDGRQALLVELNEDKSIEYSIVW